MINLQKTWQKSFTNPPYRIGLHVLFWLVYVIVFNGIALWQALSWKTSNHSILISQLFSFLNTVIIVILFYLICITSYMDLVERKKMIRGLIGLLIWLIAFAHLFYFNVILENYVMSNLGLKIPPQVKAISSKRYLDIMGDPLYLVRFIFDFFLLMFVPLCCKFFRDQLRSHEKQARLKKQNSQLEMNFLKAQIHPHFLFNTLNNIYSLITHNESKKSAEMVSGLSSLLRYALYNGKTEFISLEKEIGMLRDFIELEEVRSDDLNLEVQFPKNIPAVKIPPFLLLPLVENAFKHGVNSQLKQSCVKIDLHINEELSLQVQNTFDVEFRKKNSGGFGLLNLKKRLDYYYENKYFLETIEKENIFTATLKLPLSCPKLDA